MVKRFHLICVTWVSKQNLSPIKTYLFIEFMVADEEKWKKSWSKSFSKYVDMFAIFLWLVKSCLRSVKVLADLGKLRICEFRGKKPQIYSNTDLLKALTSIEVFGHLLSFTHSLVFASTLIHLLYFLWYITAKLKTLSYKPFF